MNKLKQLRTSKNISIRELAKKTGLESSTLSRIETGQRNMGMKYANILATYFNVSINYIMGKSLDGVMDDFFKNLENAYNSYEYNPDDDKFSQDKLDCMKKIAMLDSKAFYPIYEAIKVAVATSIDFNDELNKKEGE